MNEVDEFNLKEITKRYRIEEKRLKKKQLVKRTLEQFNALAHSYLYGTQEHRDCGVLLKLLEAPPP